MCGIAGEISFHHQRAETAAVERMIRALAPRGPDGHGLFSQGRVAFGHRRLKIIDLSEAAQQPMVDSALGLAIVFNGCIYNYPELRAELIAKGYQFFSHGDTEVILKAYHHWGKNFVTRLYGMFAFCIWHRMMAGFCLAGIVRGSSLYICHGSKPIPMGAPVWGAAVAICLQPACFIGGR
ncbi:hypothetical protein JCM17846_22550 [Iodidimonas nitroreducens]|uniref:asparagine synthase (glutamine-hydrolyzing) n=1 Tax=Iodidimonas nitroreducens TaxID=1236968 RepID=A0A5A7N893_9PROT|nr:hypothetical protein JCM17846_22550 [Iodidimonas nitroreducens]